jgi:hypothetical protein
MLVGLGGVTLSGAIGCATVQAGKCRCIAFVRGPAQLGASGFGGGGGAAESDARRCATGDVQLTVVRMPFAPSRAGSACAIVAAAASGSSDAIVAGARDFAGDGVSVDDPIVALVQRAVDLSVVREALPLARFDLVVQVVSSADDASDLQCIAAAACAALVDAALPMRDVFGAASDDAAGRCVRVVVAAHSRDVLGMLCSGARGMAAEDVCAAIEGCAESAATQTLRAFQLAAARKAAGAAGLSR